MPSSQETLTDQVLNERADHEAGHYVVAFICEFPIILRYITIENGIAKNNPDIITGGAVAADFKEKLSKEHSGMLAVAGMTAQQLGIIQRHGKEILKDPNVSERVGAGGASDINQYWEEHGRDANWQVYVGPTAELLQKHWDLVLGLSRELRERRTLYHKEAYFLLKALQGDAFCADILEVYRKHRLELDTSGPDFEILRSTQPGMKWFEPPEAFFHREGFTDVAQWPSWFESRMGYPPHLGEDEDDEADEELEDREAGTLVPVDDPPARKSLPPTLSATELSKLMVKSIFDELKRRVKTRFKEKAKRLAPWLGMD